MALPLALLAAAAWAYLLLGRGLFWLSAVRDEPTPPPPPAWPAVTAVIPARDEADGIGATIGSLLAQDYPGPFHIVLVDDNSQDGTAAAARQAAAPAPDRLAVLAGRPLAPGWTGKLWALHQGVEHAVEAAGTGPAFLWLTDADIAYTPDALRSLVARAETAGPRGRLASASLMAELRCTSPAERWLIPAFIFFFQMLYPFAWVNRPHARTAAAAGGCVLVRRTALEAVGGIGSLRSALIDDCTLAARLKRVGPVWLGLTRRAASTRPYERIEDIRRMVARSAYAQLGFSPWRLLGTVLGMALVYVSPPLLALFGAGPARWIGLLAWGGMALAFAPTLRFYRVPLLYAPALPLIAGAYLAFTLDSALLHARGRGGLWKGRVQAPLGSAG